jgi:hypothetical protein
MVFSDFHKASRTHEEVKKCPNNRAPGAVLCTPTLRHLLMKYANPEERGDA